MITPDTTRKMTDVQARGSRHTAVAARIGRVLADRIDVAAKELAATPAAAREGLIQDDELLRLERYCAQCDLVSLHLDFNVIRAPGGSAPGRFLSVVAANLEKETPAPAPSGILLYQLDVIRLEVEEPALHAQIRDYLHDEVWLGCVARTNSDSNSDMLMDPEHVSRAQDAFARMWGSSLAV